MPQPNRINVLLISISTLLLISCRDTKPLTKEEVLAFGKEIEMTIDKREANFMDDALDIKELISRTEIPSGKRESSVKEGIGQSMKLGTAIINAISTKGTYQMIRHYEKDNVHHIVFRMFSEGLINYHDMELIRSKGKVKIADLYIYLTGENFSSTLTSVYLQMVGNSSSTDEVPDNQLLWAKKLPEIRSLLNSKSYTRAKELFDELPEEIKPGRPFQIMHLQICAGLGDDSYDKALQEFEKIYPNDKNILLLMMDGYMSRDQYDKAIAVIDELDKNLGTDPILDLHRGICYKLNGDGVKGRECLERLVKNMPGLEEGNIELIKSYLMIAEYEKAKPIVEQYRLNSDFDQTSLNTLMYLYPGYNAKFGSN